MTEDLNEYTISLGRLRELPEVMRSFKEHQAKVKRAQDDFVKTKVSEFEGKLRHELNALEIPLSIGRVEVQVIEMFSTTYEGNRVEIREIHKEKPDGTIVWMALNALSTDFSDDTLKIKNADLTSRIFDAISKQVPAFLRGAYPEGCVKVTPKRAKMKGGQEQRRHLIITAMIPKRLLDRIEQETTDKTAPPATPVKAKPSITAKKDIQQ